MYEEVPIELSHGSWNKSEEDLVGVASGILDIIESVWRNPAFGEKFAKSQNERTYVTDIIVPVVKASFKKPPIKSFAFVSTAERQSIASKDRRGKTGKRPDIMFMVKRGRKIYELMFAECSRLFCDKEKEENDWVKLWRQMNDGMYWVHKGCKPKKDEFGIIGIQVAGQKLHLYVLIRDGDGVDKLFRLHSVDIPIQFTDRDTVYNFVEALLLLRKILIVNLSLLLNADRGLHGDKEDSSTVSSPPYDD
ncbi:2036_t:CDS:2 [Ambispora leptoticha]|uniref:2036_t:CDS:1 n=1 Tax=Ambispora leptoticha TaxID=144679 RepID=A0A9N8YZ44_9GLOM|nr:2036_t:CDS:2 [Ambispora leptoticha]